MKQTLLILNGWQLKAEPNTFFYPLRLLILFAAFFITTSASAQLTQVWKTAELVAPVTGEVSFVAQAVDQQQNLLILGRVYNATSGTRIVLHKVAPDGTKLWSRTYAGHTESISDHASAMELDSKGNVYILGSSDMAGEYKSFLLRYSSEGTLVWEKFYNDPRSGSMTMNGLAVGTDDAIYTTGYKKDGEQTFVVTQKITASNSLVWESIHALGADQDSFGSNIHVDAMGGVYVPVQIYDYMADYSFKLIKYEAASGNQVFVRNVGTNTLPKRESVNEVLTAPSGNIYLITTTEDAYYAVMSLYKLSSGGDMISKTNIGDGLDVRFNPIYYLRKAALLEDESVVILCINAVYRSTADYFMERYASDGTRMWQKTFNEYVDNKVNQFAASSFALTHDGKIALTGTYSSFVPSPAWYESPDYIETEKMALALYDQMGNELWREVNQEYSHISNYGRGISANPDNSIYMTGWLAKPGEASLVVLKYADCSGLQASAGEDKTICAGSGVQLAATGGAFYAWSPEAGLSATNMANPMASPDKTTTYTVTITNGNGCTVTDQVTVTVNPKLTASITSEQTTTGCSGGTVKLSVETGDNLTYQWMLNGQEIQNATSSGYTASVSGNYTAVVSNGNCSVTTAPVSVDISSAISNNTIGKDQAICAGSVAETITGSSPAGSNGTFEYKWEQSADGTNFTPIQGAINKDYSPGNVTATTWFRRKVISAECSHTSEPVKIAVNPLPSVSLGAFETVCLNSTPLVLKVGSPEGGIYSGPGVSNGMFNPAEAGAGTHTITYTYAGSGQCEVQATQTIVVKSDCDVTGAEPDYELELYPNPTRNVFHVKLHLEKSTDLTIRIVDAWGRVIEEVHFVQVSGRFKHKFDVKDKAIGVYIVQFITADGVKTRRVVKR